MICGPCFEHCKPPFVAKNPKCETPWCQCLCRGPEVTTDAAR
jgi:hypothetical protein